VLRGRHQRHDLGVVRAKSRYVEHTVAIRAIDNVGLTADGDLRDVEIDIVPHMNLVAGVETDRCVALEVGGRDGFRCGPEL
jgi:hypothetical protein